MTVNLVHEIRHADPGPEHHRRLNRLKYVAPAEMLAEYRASNARIGRTVCPVCDYISEHLGDDVIDVERAIYTHPVWGPSVLYETIVHTPKFNDPSTEGGAFIAAAVQHTAAVALVEFPWDVARPYIEAIFAHEDTVFVGEDALDVLLAAVKANHPNPGRFAAKDHVITKLPTPRDFSDWKAENFPQPEEENDVGV